VEEDSLIRVKFDPRVLIVRRDGEEENARDEAEQITKGAGGVFGEAGLGARLRRALIRRQAAQKRPSADWPQFGQKGIGQISSGL
jgi:hypothetical protein